MSRRASGGSGCGTTAGRRRDMISEIQQAEPVNAIHADLPCVRCGYNLRTLQAHALCPECNTPIKDSTLLPGFRFLWLRTARRTALGICLWIITILAETLLIIGFTALVRWTHELNYLSLRPFWIALRVLDSLAKISTFVAIYLIAFPAKFSELHRYPRLGWLITIVATGPLVSELASRLDLFIWGSQVGIGNLLKAINACLSFAAVVSQALVWFLLLSHIKRKDNLRLWILGLIAFILSIIFALHHPAALLFSFVTLDEYNIGNIQMFWWFHHQIKEQFAYVRNIGLIVMLIVLAYYLRCIRVADAHRVIAKDPGLNGDL